MIKDYLSSHVQIKPVIGFDGYFVDNFGVVYTSKYQSKSGGNKGGYCTGGSLKPLKPWLSGPHGKKYETVTLWNGWNRNKGKKKKVHQIVLEAFCGEKPHGMSGCHNDGNQLNNNLSNLRWATHSENMHDAVVHGTSNRGDRHPLRKVSSSDVIDIRKRVLGGDSIKGVASDYGVANTCISRIVSGERWGHVK